MATPAPRPPGRREKEKLLRLSACCSSVCTKSGFREPRLCRFVMSLGFAYRLATERDCETL